MRMDWMVKGDVMISSVGGTDAMSRIKTVAFYFINPK
jgi:hypothetical protein